MDWTQYISAIFCPPGPLGGSEVAPGGFGGVWHPKIAIISGGPILTTKCNAMGHNNFLHYVFWDFRPKRANWGKKGGVLGQSRVCKKVHFF